MMVQLSEFVTQLENWKNGKAMILYSQGNTFCSGADLTTVKNITDPEGAARMSHLMHNTLYRLSTLPLITVALIQGKALGGGAELSLACDFRLLAPSASIQFVQLKMGTITGFGGATRLVGLLGQTAALKVLLSSQKLDAAEALKFKLADEVLSENEDLLEQTKRWLDPYLHGASEVIRAMKKAVAHAAWSNSEDSFSNERRLFSTVWGGPANLEALKKNIKH
ncbi:ethylmalonyl-CoA decarboxylase-like [Centruroides sculpturatus]|uniref:ethylmalonyl-CoA decarboxylase-like n=1 Tax=Centruroides sculpturatus TaxID=218467 RepID=UPI000C6F025C|nr:ethylmalonyl-CoA decarboxylase-like [Centruroides sculpturatus]